MDLIALVAVTVVDCDGGEDEDINQILCQSVAKLMPQPMKI